MALTGGCLCGLIRYRTSATALWICHCHCEKCRRQTGAAVATYVGFQAGAVTWLKEPTRYRSSSDVERSFCPACGSSMGFHRAQETFVHLGSLDKPSELPIETVWKGHTWFKEHITWFDTADQWPRHLEFPPGRAEELDSLSGKAIKG